MPYVSEPVFAGAYNEVIRIFHNEEKVRSAAMAALQRAVASGAWEQVSETHFLAPVRFSDFAEFDVKRQVAYSSNRDGTLSRVAERSPDRFEVLPAVQTRIGARTMALDQKTGRVYLVASDVTEDPGIPVSGRGHYKTVPGTARLLYLDPQTP